MAHAESMAASQTQALWTPKLQKESDFQAQKVRRAIAETAIQGGALSSEHRHIAPIVDEYKQKRTKAKSERERNEKRKLAAMKPINGISFGGKPVYLDPSCLPLPITDTVPVITKHRMQLVEDVCLVAGNGVVVVKSPNDAPRSVHWVVALSGGAMVDSAYFVSGASHGSCMSWLPAIAISRVIWISSAAIADEPLLSALIVWACGLPASKWSTRSHEWTTAKYLERQPKVSNLLRVVTPAEKGEARFGHWKTLTYPDFLVYVSKLDASVSGYKDAPAGSLFSSS